MNKYNITTAEELQHFVKNKIEGYIETFETRENSYEEKMANTFFTDNYNLPGVYYFERDGKFYTNNYERGSIDEKEIEIEELLYNIFNSETRSDATYYETKKRTPGTSPRRIWFPKQLEYLYFFGKEFAEKRKKEQEEILKENPFNDELFK